MKIPGPLKIIAPALLAFLAPAAFAGPIFVKIGEIEGESRRSGFEKWIEADSIGLDGPIVRSSNGGVRITKRIDKSSPLLAVAAVTGRPIRLATLVIREEENVIAVLNLRDARITAINQTGTGKETTETLTLVYRSILFNYPSADGATAFADLDQGVDTDGDGMTDDFEDFHGFDKSVKDGEEDSDKDGLSNYTESRLGLNPRSKQSYFRALGGRSPDNPKRFALSWETKPGVQYDVYCTQDLGKPFEFLERITAKTFSESWDAGTEGLKGFYRVQPVLE